MNEARSKKLHPLVLVVFALELGGLAFLLIVREWVVAGFSAVRLVGLALRKEWALLWMWAASLFGAISAMFSIGGQITNRDLAPIEPTTLLVDCIALALAVVFALLYTRPPLFEWVGADRA